MPFSAVFGAYNVQATINQWFYTNITSRGNPAWMPSARVVYDWGVEKPLISGYSGHAFSINHLNDRETQSFQGMRVDNGTAGSMRQGQFEINCWIDRRVASAQYMNRLRQMRDMVSRLFQNELVPLVNVYASTTNAPSATARLVLGSPEFQYPASDPVDPDLWRIRGVATYTWNERDG
jgi:hypothetical protein